MSQDDAKRRAAEAALAYVHEGDTIGVGTGSTVNHFIDLLDEKGPRIEAAVSSSEASTERLRARGIKVRELNEAGALDLYVDGADEADPHLRLIKGGGGALTREKIVAEASRRFVCIVDESKCVRVLGDFPLPVEVIPMARSMIARKLVGIGGQPKLREHCTTDNGNLIIDVAGLDLTDPVAVEQQINQWPGVVSVGLFARRGADLLIVGGAAGVETRQAKA